LGLSDQAETMQAPVSNLSELVDIGGYSLYLHCTGSGSPPVVFDAGLGFGWETWSQVQPAVSEFARACSYSRAGLGKSDPSPLPRTSAQMVQELRALLLAANVTPPYLLMGHSFGGLNVQLYAMQYPDEVLGAVLVDSPSHDTYTLWEEVLSPEQLARLVDDLSDPESNPESAGYAEILLSCEQVASAGPFPDIPLAVLTSGLPMRFPPEWGEWPEEKMTQIWRQEQARLASLSSKGRQVIAEKSGHFIQNQQPDLVIEAIREVSDAVRTKLESFLDTALSSKLEGAVPIGQ
jgi:pimeloyl-ACP methyl ester carboxylesterase